MSQTYPEVGQPCRAPWRVSQASEVRLLCRENGLCVNFNHLIGRCCTIQLCPKSPWVYSLSFAYMQSYDGAPAFAHSLRPRRPAPRPPLMPLVAPPPRVLLPRPPGLPAPPAAATWAADRVRVRPALPPAFASPCSPSSRTLNSPSLL